MEAVEDIRGLLEAIDEALAKNDVNTALKKTHEALARLPNENHS